MNTLGFFYLDDQEKLERFSKKSISFLFFKKIQSQKEKIGISYMDSNTCTGRHIPWKYFMGFWLGQAHMGDIDP